MRKRPGRQFRFGVILSEAEHEMLGQLSEAVGLDRSDFVRQVLRRLHGEHQAKTAALSA